MATLKVGDRVGQRTGAGRGIVQVVSRNGESVLVRWDSGHESYVPSWRLARLVGSEHHLRR